MEKEDFGRCIYTLTNLQIGDLQSYLSHLSLFLALESRNMYILVDNRPWREDLVSKPTRLWQLMVTKARLSPFANTRGRKERKIIGDPIESPALSKSNTSDPPNVKKWLSLVDLTLSQKQAMLPVKKLRNSLIANSKLHRTLYGFIVFEVSWRDVRGINYLNELQTDTSLAVEAKCMRKWEFDSIMQAASSIYSWFRGTPFERNLLKDYLDAALGEIYHDSVDSFPRNSQANADDYAGDNKCFEDEPSCCSSSNFSVYTAKMDNQNSGMWTPSPDGLYKRRTVSNSVSCNTEDGLFSDKADDPIDILSQTSSEDDVETLYRDVLILFRFNDHDLPFKLKEIITSDIKLLTLLESGLPSWVLFLQSYPVFCHLYRPWMSPLARALYVIISIVTVLIGFYDLYKNVPLLKSTASHLFGPLFDWIETWEMISRIKYLGTMLFFHNFQKAVKWFLMMTRGIRSFLSVLTEPMTGPFVEFLDIFLPLWSMCVELIDSSFSVAWMVVESVFTMIGDLIEIILLPAWYIMNVLWNIVTAVVYPVYWILSEVLYSPVRLVLGFSNLVAMLFTYLLSVIGDIWLFASSIFQFSRGVQSTVSSYEVSLWRSLWNVLFSQIFRALRSILNGLVAFLTACNRHRLSIYNHTNEFIGKMSRSSNLTQSKVKRRDGRSPEVPTTPKGWKDTRHKMKSRHTC